MSIYTNDIDTLRQMISQSIPQVLNSAVTIVSVLGAMIVLNIQLTIITHFMVAVHSVLRIILRTLVIFPGQKGEHIHPSNLYTTYFSVCAIGVHPA